MYTGIRTEVGSTNLTVLIYLFLLLLFFPKVNMQT
jgi:hypothetical protein